METSYSLEFGNSVQKTLGFIEQLPNPAFLISQTGEITQVNEGLLEVTGYALEELVGCHFSKVLPFKSQRDAMRSELQQVPDDGTVLEIEWLDKQGRVATALALVRKRKSQELQYLIHFLQYAKRDLPLAHRFADKLLASPHLGVVILDASAHIVEISKLACKILGINRLDVLNKHIDQAFVGIPEEHRLIQRELLEGVKVSNKAISWTNDNQRYELLADSNTLHDETGKMVGAYVIFKDVTNLRSFDQKIERSDRLAMIGQIAAGTAHEIRNPLTSIRGFLQMFLQMFAEQGLERERSYTEIMLTEINRINSLVSEFLLLSKPRDVQYSIVDLNTVFEELLPFIENQALLHGIEVEYPSRGTLPLVVGDAELLKQVFINICKNGIEAMNKDGVLTISHHFDEEGDRVSIDIHDNGPGIPMYVIDKIFDPFYTTKDEGTGLGLSVCQKIIHDVGGQIRVSSKGFGTTFHILLPYL